MSIPAYPLQWPAGWKRTIAPQRTRARSACASPENFDSELGRKIARQNAVSKVWPLLGFRLRDQLASHPYGTVVTE